MTSPDRRPLVIALSITPLPDAEEGYVLTLFTPDPDRPTAGPVAGVVFEEYRLTLQGARRLKGTVGTALAGVPLPTRADLTTIEGF